MTPTNPFEAPHAATQLSRPSILGPTLITAAVAAVLFAIPSIGRGIDPMFSCCWNCTAGLMISCLGALPAWMLARQGPYFTGGHGFAAAFFGVGGGAGLGVLLQMFAPGMDKAKLGELAKDMAQQILEEAQRQGQSLPMPQSELEDGFKAMCVAAPVPMALAGTVLAGFVGLLTLNVLRRRSPPGTQPPVNPYSSPPA